MQLNPILQEIDKNLGTAYNVALSFRNNLSNMSNMSNMYSIMTEPKYLDIENILSVIECANTHLDMDAMRKPIMEMISKTIPAEGVIFVLSDSKYLNVDGSNAVSLGFDVNLQEQLPRYRLFNPFYTYANPDRYVVTIDDMFPYSEWEKHPFYNYFCKPLGIYHKMVLYLKEGPRNYGVICLSRSKKGLNFSFEEQQIGDVIAQLVSKAMSNIRLLSKVIPNKNSLQNINEYSSTGILLIDRDLNIMGSNLKGKEYCYLLNQESSEKFGLKNSHNVPLPAEVLQHCSVLKELFKRGKRITPVSLKEYVFTKQIGWVCTECQLIWLNADQASKPYILVSLSSLFEERNTARVAIMEKYKLTEKEMEIIEYVPRGFSNSEIGQKLFISQVTVETHLRHIFQKTGVKNRASLANLAKAI
jgi:DNA-binding CsgD family transcriptional regulator